MLIISLILGNPLVDFKLQSFLDRLVYKRPKKNAGEKKTNLEGASKRKFISRTDVSIPVNDVRFIQQKKENVREDEIFFYEFFTRFHKTRGNKPKKVKEEDDYASDSVDEDEINRIMQAELDDDFYDNEQALKHIVEQDAEEKSQIMKSKNKTDNDEDKSEWQKLQDEKAALLAQYKQLGGEDDVLGAINDEFSDESSDYNYERLTANDFEEDEELENVNVDEMFSGLFTEDDDDMDEQDFGASDTFASAEDFAAILQKRV